MTVYDATTKEEIAAALASEHPDKIEIEPGKVAVYDDALGGWIYHDPEHGDLILQI